MDDGWLYVNAIRRAVIISRGAPTVAHCTNSSVCCVRNVFSRFRTTLITGEWLSERILAACGPVPFELSKKLLQASVAFLPFRTER